MPPPSRWNHRSPGRPPDRPPTPSSARYSQPALSDIVAIAAETAAKANRELPADQVLRTLFKTQRGLLPGDSTRITEMVFAFFRWKRWLDQRFPAGDQIRQAGALADKFAREPQSFPDEDLKTRAVPEWVTQELDVTADWVRSLQRPPKLWLRARPGTGAVLANKLRDCLPLGPGPLNDALEYRGRNDLFRSPEFRAGEFEVQDLSSQAVGWICAPLPGQTWWDACAGEGGKALHLADLMQNRGLIWATDRAAWRLQRLKRRAARAHLFNYRTALWQQTEHLPTRTRFDGVLVDAPCSGIGTWGRNPHARWTTTLNDVHELAALQQTLLSQAANAVKPRGKLVYSVCTLARSETTAVADSFQQKFPDFQPVALSLSLAAETPAPGRYFFLPEQAGGNGMFVALWERR